MTDLNARDAKLVQWLGEAYAKEAELEVDLAAHISLTSKKSYKKRLQDHLKETKAHKKAVGARIKKLGGTATAGPEIPGVPGVLGEVAGKAVSAVKGQVGAARAAVNDEAETHLRNAQEELREEHVEIAIYAKIEALAGGVGDKETQKLAKGIRREEERMAKFLDAELPRLVKDVVKSQIPRELRAPTAKPRRRTSANGASAASGRSASRSRSVTGTRSAASGTRSGAGRKRAASSRASS